MWAFLFVVTVLCWLMPLYVYAGYPALLWLLTRHKTFSTSRPAQNLPSVTLIISCFNEEDVIAEKIQNSLALDYPKDRLKILAVSDGSTDRTDEIVIRSFHDQGVMLVRQDGRLGKTMGLNLAMQQVDSDIVVFSDANAIYDKNSIRFLVRHFADNAVGYVVGAALYTDGDDTASAGNENLYWKYELAIKTMESSLHSVVGGDVAIYAIRKDLWEPLQRRDINDFVNPLQIVRRGYRGVFDPEARCYEKTAGAFDLEIRRKERIVNRSIRGLFRVKEVMSPRVSFCFAWQVISHKLLRWLIPLFVALAVLGSFLLSLQGSLVFLAIVAAVFGMTAFGFVGHLLSLKKSTLPRILSMPYYFIMVNVYALRGVFKALGGQTEVVWKSARGATTAKQDEWFRQAVGFCVALTFLSLPLLWFIGRY